MGTYSVEKVQAIGISEVNIKFTGEERKLVLAVLPGHTSTLLGRNWMSST